MPGTHKTEHSTEWAGTHSASELDVMIEEITDIEKVDLAEILEESKGLGYGMIERLIREWKSGETDFSKENEAYFAFVADGKVVGVGGVNEEPYLKIKEYGRMRHLYVLKSWRRKGIGSAIVGTTIDFAKKHYILMTLMTPKDGRSDSFYEGIGFEKCTSLNRVSHTLDLHYNALMPGTHKSAQTIP